MNQEQKNKFPFAVAMMVANYAKRHAEYLWDNIFSTKFGEKMRKLPSSAKHGIELGLNILTAVLEDKVASSTPLKKLVKEVLKDSGPEFSKRMMNGVRHKLDHMNQHSTPAQKTVLETLLALDNEELKNLLAWLVETPTDKRREVMAQIRSLTAEQLKRLGKMPPEELGEFLNIIFDGTAAKENGRTQREESGTVLALKRASDRVSEARLSLKEKRKGGWLL